MLFAKIIKIGSCLSKLYSLSKFGSFFEIQSIDFANF